MTRQWSGDWSLNRSPLYINIIIFFKNITIFFRNICAVTVSVISLCEGAFKSKISRTCSVKVNATPFVKGAWHLSNCIFDQVTGFKYVVILNVNQQFTRTYLTQLFLKQNLTPTCHYEVSKGYIFVQTADYLFYKTRNIWNLPKS